MSLVNQFLLDYPAARQAATSATFATLLKMPRVSAGFYVAGDLLHAATMLTRQTQRSENARSSKPSFR